MEPRRDDGDDAPSAPAFVNCESTPQWSPVVTTGTTPGRRNSQRRNDSGRNGAPS